MKKRFILIFIAALFLGILSFVDSAEAGIWGWGHFCDPPFETCEEPFVCDSEFHRCCDPSLLVGEGQTCYCDAECASRNCVNQKCVGGGEGGCTNNSDCAGLNICTANGLTQGYKCSLDPDKPEVYKQCVPDSGNYWCEEDCCNSRCLEHFDKPGSCSDNSCVCGEGEEECAPRGEDCSILPCCNEESDECCPDPDKICRLKGHCEVGEEEEEEEEDGGGGIGGAITVELENPLKAETFGELIDNIINFIFNIALVIVPIMIVIAGFMMVLAAGDPEQISRAKKLIIYTLIGFAIVLLSKGLIALFSQIFQKVE
jgi:hypothetical protein